MPTLRRRALLASLLDTAPAMRSRSVASASMKQLTVEPLPTPITAPARRIRARLARPSPSVRPASSTVPRVKT
jgi:hypothetical protein